MKKLFIFLLTVILAVTVSLQPAEANTMWGKVEIKKGMIGKVQVLKETSLYQINKKKLKVIKKLKKGTEYGVYEYTKSYGGLYKVADNRYIKKSKSIQYSKKPVQKVYSTKQIVDLNDEKIVLIETNNGQGSGIIIAKGLILTNQHVIDGASEATVTLNNGEQYKVEGVVESDEKKDIALLKTTKIFKTSGVSIRTSSKGLSKGEKVVAIGSPVGLQNTVSEGIISSFRNLNGVSCIQTNADIDNGSSGGGLFNNSGQLIGITSSGIDSGSANLNFAVTSDEFVPMVNKYISRTHKSIESSFPLPSKPLPSTQDPVLGDIALGMTKKQVKELSGGKLLSEKSNQLFYENVLVLGYSAGVIYNFENNRLTSISIFHNVVDNQGDLDLLEKYFVVMLDKISKTYGKPYSLDTNWFDDKDVYALSALWRTKENDVFLTVRVKVDSNYGGILITLKN